MEIETGISFSNYSAILASGCPQVLLAKRVLRLQAAAPWKQNLRPPLHLLNVNPFQNKIPALTPTHYSNAFRFKL